LQELLRIERSENRLLRIVVSPVRVRVSPLLESPRDPGTAERHARAVVGALALRERPMTPAATSA
jgi:hypothetical protein